MSTTMFLSRTCTRINATSRLRRTIFKNKVALEAANVFAINCCLQPNQEYHVTAIRCKSIKPSVKIVVDSRQKALKNVWVGMTIKELAEVCNRTVKEVFTALYYVDRYGNYSDVKPQTPIDDAILISEIVKRFDMRCKIVPDPRKPVEDTNKDYKDVKRRPLPDPSMLVKRHPVVTIMGHVDHGKTTLLDSLRHSSVVESEFGGITQHIGAFNVSLPGGEKVTFLDTPGHAAFSAMRQRGANTTDIVVLVVAADDGVMEQTVQSIEMAKSAQVPIIVAINKIDKPTADIPRTQNMLAQQGILVEDLGGEVQSVNISALKGTNLEGLTETIVMQAELLNLQGDPKGLVEGTIIESSVDPHRGKLATVLVQRGTLCKGAVLVSDTAWAKVRSMFDHSGAVVKKASLSEAVQIIGWREIPPAGSEVLEVESEKIAHTVVKYREAKLKEKHALEQRAAYDEKQEDYTKAYKKLLQEKRASGKAFARLFFNEDKVRGLRPKENVVDEGVPKLNVIVKGDVDGSVEAILDALDTYEDNKCRLNVVHYGIGGVTDSDIELAKTFDAIIYTFNTVVLPGVRKESAKIRHYNVIYKLIDNLKEELNSKLPTVSVEETLGKADVLQIFEVKDRKKKINIAGSKCTEGNLKKSGLYRVMRNGEVIYEGKLHTMKHMKNDVETVKKGVECGLRLDDAELELEVGDEIICYHMVPKTQTIDWNPGF